MSINNYFQFEFTSAGVGAEVSFIGTTGEKGRLCFYFVMAKKTAAPVAIPAGQPICVTDYGTVLFSGYGEKNLRDG